MKDRFMGGLILALVFTAAQAADPQDASAPEMKLTLKNGQTLTIDADKLGPAPLHASTVAFVFQFDPHSSKTAKEISDALAALEKNSAFHPALKKNQQDALLKLQELHAIAAQKPASTNEADLKPFIAHLATHDVSAAKIEVVRQACIRIIEARTTSNTPPAFIP